MILATNSIGAGPQASERVYELCSTAKSLDYIASINPIEPVGSISYGLSTNRSIAAKKQRAVLVASSPTTLVGALHCRMKA